VTYPTRIPQERHENKHTAQLGRVPAAQSFFFKNQQQVMPRLPKMLHRSIFFSLLRLLTREASKRQFENSSHHREKTRAAGVARKEHLALLQINPPRAPIDNEMIRARQITLAPCRVFFEAPVAFPPLNSVS
jgi:hypothetical protein